MLSKSIIYTKLRRNRQNRSLCIFRGGMQPFRPCIWRWIDSCFDLILLFVYERFEKVPLVTPNGDILIKEMNFEVTSGTNVIICGPNGCGKSSLFRVLGEVRARMAVIWNIECIMSIAFVKKRWGMAVLFVDKATFTLDFIVRVC